MVKFLVNIHHKEHVLYSLIQRFVVSQLENIR